MSYKGERTEEVIKSKDILIYILKNWRVLLIVMLAGAVFLGAYKGILRPDSVLISPEQEQSINEEIKKNEDSISECTSTIDVNEHKIAANNELIETAQNDIENQKAILAKLESIISTYSNAGSQAVESLVNANAQLATVNKTIYDYTVQISNLQEENYKLSENNVSLEKKLLELKKDNEKLKKTLTPQASVVGIRSIIKYGIFGAILGAFAVCGIAFLKCVHYKKLRSADELEERYHVRILGNLYKIPEKCNRNKIDKLINKWAGYSDTVDEEQQYKLISTAIQLASTGENKKVILTGTVDEALLNNVEDKMKKFLPHNKGYQLYKVTNPIYDADSLLEFKESLIILVEAKDVSYNSEISRLLELLQASKADVLGAVML